jgi:hypothetical protein
MLNKWNIGFKLSNMREIFEAFKIEAEKINKTKVIVPIEDNINLIIIRNKEGT